MHAKTNLHLPIPIQVWHNGGQWRIGYSGGGNYWYINPDIAGLDSSFGPTGGEWSMGRGTEPAPTFRIKKASIKDKIKDENTPNVHAHA